MEEEARKLYETLIDILHGGTMGLLSAVADARNKLTWDEADAKTRSAMRALAQKLTVRTPKA